jgi:hypothetical protein
VLDAREEVGQREVFSKEISPEADYDFQNMHARKSPLIASLFASIDHEISFSC